jgi:hypothetical protein
MQLVDKSNDLSMASQLFYKQASTYYSAQFFAGGQLPGWHACQEPAKKAFTQ